MFLKLKLWYANRIAKNMPTTGTLDASTGKVIW